MSTTSNETQDELTTLIQEQYQDMTSMIQWPERSVVASLDAQLHWASRGIFTLYDRLGENGEQVDR